jgi:hypothetical protein
MELTPGAWFYPYWTLARAAGLGCTWKFGQVCAGQT